MESTMLIVDDNEMNREILGLLFRDDYEILEAENGEEALAMLESCQGHIDIVLLDLFMENMNGLEVLERRRHLEYFKHVPVVVITASNTMEDQVHAFELGASDWINKPFIPEIVCSRVHNVMASKRRLLSIEMEAEKMKVKSEIDQMTGLLNKTTAEQTIQTILENSPNQTHALLVIDIDNFKSVNDISGHQAGDHTIRIVADLISGLFRKTDVVGRIGGDEYVVFMTDIPSMDVVKEKVNELIQMMKYKPNLTIPENVSLSIGFAGTQGIATDYTELFRRADEALYMAKEAGKARAREYGIDIVECQNDERYTVLLLSRNRNVCSIVHAFVPAKLRLVEVLYVDDLKNVTQTDKDKMVFAYIDVSEEKQDIPEIWEKVKACEWLCKLPLIAICEEGNMMQYQAVINAGANDLISAPIESAAFKRRTLYHIEEAGIEKE